MVGCRAVLIQTHAPKQVGLVASLGEYADAIGIDVRKLGTLHCDRWINLSFRFRPQCIQIIQTRLFKGSCDLSPHCGHTVYQVLNSTFWKQIGLCYGVGLEPRILTTINNNKIFDNNWHKLCHYESTHIGDRFIFKDYLILIGNQYLAISEHFLDAFVIHTGEHYERQIPTPDTDGKFCFHTINDYRTVTVGPKSLDQIYYHSYILQHLNGIHNGTRYIDYHTMYIIRKGVLAYHIGMDVVDYQCLSAYQTTSLHYFTSIVGHVIFTAVISLFDIIVNILYTLLLPLGYVLDPFVFILIALTCLYLRYPLVSSSIFATTISISVVILRSIILNEMD